MSSIFGISDPHTRLPSLNLVLSRENPTKNIQIKHHLNSLKMLYSPSAFSPISPISPRHHKPQTRSPSPTTNYPQTPPSSPVSTHNLQSTTSSPHRKQLSPTEPQSPAAIIVKESASTAMDTEPSDSDSDSDSEVHERQQPRLTAITTTSPTNTPTPSIPSLPSPNQTFNSPSLLSLYQSTISDPLSIHSTTTSLLPLYQSTISDPFSTSTYNYNSTAMTHPPIRALKPHIPPLRLQIRDSSFTARNRVYIAAKEGKEGRQGERLRLQLLENPSPYPRAGGM